MSMHMHEELELRFGADVAQVLCDKIAQCEQREIQYLEVKQMGEILERYRTRVRHMLRNLKEWQLRYARCKGDELEQVYTSYEGIFIRNQLRDAWQLYVTVNRDYHEMRRAYLASLKRVPDSRTAA